MGALRPWHVAIVLLIGLVVALVVVGVTILVTKGRKR